jgi:hypothetical protein
MAIEFRCPYCAAAIRVGDDAAGKPGRCPRCATRLTVPRPAGLEPSASPTATDQPPEVPPPAPEPVVELPVVVAAPLIPPGALPDPTLPAVSSPIAARVRRRRRPASTVVIPLLCGLMLFGGLGWYVWQFSKSSGLSGTLPGEELEQVELPPIVVSVEHVPLTKPQTAALLESLAEQPLPLLSDLMQMQIRGTPQGLSISLQRGPKTVWYRVDPRGHAGIADVLARSGAELESARASDLRSASATFLRQYALVREQQAPLTSLTTFRDRLGLASLVGGLGHHLAAAVAQRQYPCVAETSDGSLYFLMPPGLQQFELVGRMHADERAMIPGRLTVVVRPAGQPDASEPELTAEPVPMSIPDPTEPLPEN